MWSKVRLLFARTWRGDVSFFVILAFYGVTQAIILLIQGCGAGSLRLLQLEYPYVRSSISALSIAMYSLMALTPLAGMFFLIGLFRAAKRNENTVANIIMLISLIAVLSLSVFLTIMGAAYIMMIMFMGLI